MSRSFKVVEGDLKKKSDKKNDNFLIVLKVINFRNQFPFLKKKNGQDHWAYLLRNNIILAYLGIASTHYLPGNWLNPEISTRKIWHFYDSKFA